MKENKSITDKFNFRKNVVSHDSADRDLFAISRAVSPSLQSQLDRMKREDYEPIDELQSDVYFALFKYIPKFASEVEMDPKFMLNHMILQEGIKSTQYKELRIMTTLDDLAALSGTETLMKQLEPLINQKRDELEKLLQDQQTLEEALEQMAASGEGESKAISLNGTGQGQEGEEGKGKGNKKNPKKYSLEEVKKLLEENYQKTKNLVGPTERRQIRQAFTEAARETGEHSEFIQNWGLENDATFMAKPYKEKIMLLDKIKNSRKLKKMAELVGKLRPLAMKMAKEKVKKIPTRIQDIVLGDNPNRMLPLDLVKLRRPKLRRGFVKDYSEKKLRQYDYSGNRKKGKGPIVCCIDGSGSMGGNNEIWAKALALGLLEIARLQKRDAIFIQFSSGPIDAQFVDYFEKEKGWDVEKIIDFAEKFINGGTDFEPPLDYSQKTIDDHPDFTKADIVFITDGESGVRDNFLKQFVEWRDKKNILIQTILIDTSSYSDSAVKEFSTKITELKNLDISDDSVVNHAKSIFNGVI